MPNHVSNILYIKANDENQLKEIIETCKGENGALDFNKFIPEIPDNDDWYDWRLDHWGTKWNAYEISSNVENLTFILYFDTAWGNCLPVINKISETFPNCKIEYMYASDDTGGHQGKYELYEGDYISEYVPKNYSKEAYELAFDIRGGEEDYKLVDGNYVWVDWCDDEE